MNTMIIAISGGTGSGKSYLAKSLASTYPKKKILIIAGGGIRIGNQIKQFKTLIKKTDFPFVTT